MAVVAKEVALRLRCRCGDGVLVPLEKDRVACALLPASIRAGPAPAAQTPGDACVGGAAWGCGGQLRRGGRGLNQTQTPAQTRRQTLGPGARGSSSIPAWAVAVAAAELHPEQLACGRHPRTHAGEEDPGPEKERDGGGWGQGEEASSPSRALRYAASPGSNHVPCISGGGDCGDRRVAVWAPPQLRPQPGPAGCTMARGHVTAGGTTRWDAWCEFFAVPRSVSRRGATAGRRGCFGCAGVAGDAPKGRAGRAARTRTRWCRRQGTSVPVD